jgi:hypothetical protein
VPYKGTTQTGCPAGPVTTPPPPPIHQCATGTTGSTNVTVPYVSTDPVGCPVVKRPTTACATGVEGGTTVDYHWTSSRCPVGTATVEPPPVYECVSQQPSPGEDINMPRIPYVWINESCPVD